MGKSQAYGATHDAASCFGADLYQKSNASVSAHRHRSCVKAATSTGTSFPVVTDGEDVVGLVGGGVGGERASRHRLERGQLLPLITRRHAVEQHGDELVFV